MSRFFYLRGVDDHDHTGLAVGKLGLGAVEPVGVGIIHGDREHAGLEFGGISKEPFHQIVQPVDLHQCRWRQA